MHLTPEQIDRQPFKMSRRGGYDIVQVRDFLREIAAEMRERQQVRERLAKNGNGDAAVEAQAKAAIEAAEARAAEIIADAELTAGSAAALAAADAKADSMLAAADVKADRMLAAAQTEADAMVDSAETRAQARSASVLAEAQVRLDELLAQERDLRRKIERQTSAGSVIPQTEGTSPIATARDHAPVAEQDLALAEFMKSAVRAEDI